jgi:hypothetical protein
VFDPLAIMMLLAATESYRWERQRRAAMIPVTPDPVPESVNETTPDPLPDPEPPGLGPKPENPVEYQVLDDVSESDYVESLPPHTEDDKVIPVSDPEMFEDDEDLDEDDERTKAAKRAWKEHNPGQTLKEQRRLLATGRIQYLPWEDYLDLDHDLDDTVPFGDEFPTDAKKGHMFLRTNALPTTLFKFNGTKWIEVDKNISDRYVYNDAYIDYLIEKIKSGEYDPELLNDSERYQLEQRLRQEIN